MCNAKLLCENKKRSVNRVNLSLTKSPVMRASLAIGSDIVFLIQVMKKVREFNAALAVTASNHC